MPEQRPFGELIPYEEALETIVSETSLIDEKETIEITEAAGSKTRVIAEDVKSGIDVPPFSRAAMDGFAVKADETYGAGKFDPIELEIIGNIHAGDEPSSGIEENQAFQISTGAPMPDGTDAVVMVERTEREEDTVSIYKPVHPGENVSPRGEDIEKGEVILKRGDVLGPAKIGALAAIGRETLEVFRPPRIGIIPTGNEIIPLGKELQSGQIYDINSYTLSSVVERNGGIAVRGTIVQDSMEGLKKQIEKKAEELDMVLFSGGSSVGDRDMLVDALRSIGEVKFHGVKQKPGKPTMFGKVEGTPVIGMPGYPTSCLNTALNLIKPALRKMARLPEAVERTTKAVLQKRVNSPLGRKQFMTVKLEDGKAYPVYKESGTITSMTEADGYFEIPVNMDLMDKGDEVTVILL